MTKLITNAHTATVYACGPSRLLAGLRAVQETGGLPYLMFEDFGSEVSEVNADGSDAYPGPALGRYDPPFYGGNGRWAGNRRRGGRNNSGCSAKIRRSGSEFLQKRELWHLRNGRS